MLDYFFGQIQALGCNYAPVDWAICAGQQMVVSQNAALFSLLGTQFGGNGQTTYNLPDLQGRVVIGAGQGPGLPYFDQGETVGAENVTLTALTMPMHNHGVTGGGGTLMVSNQLGTSFAPTKTINTLGVVNDGAGNNYYSYAPAASDPANVALNTGSTSSSSQPLGVTGTGTAFSVLQPVQAFTYAILLYGVYPTFP